MIWNLPNLLTLSRIGLIPVFVSLVYLPEPWGLLLPALFFGLAALTDWADGYFARRRGMLTSFGKLLDPVADKLLVISALVLLVSQGRAPLAFVLIIIAREITIMALREYTSGLGIGGVPVSRTAKWKTGFQMAAILMLLLQNGLLDIPLQLPGAICLFIATLLTVYTGYRYVVGAWPHIQQRNQEAGMT
ncbi:MAG: CDP-diacylglycerol--glycerol-3-phosphate 3-phosphatidyltransferase [Magnetococcales bacterium]|nr:CDP-diacylglycerol--glycerol-3-phosphate 3-phosphatidyltransferase [Magnetococcales bacterium]